MHAVDYLFQYSLARASGVTWGPSYWAQVESIFVRVEADVLSRLNLAREHGLIDEDQYYVLMEHMIWQEVNAEVEIGYSRAPRSVLERWRHPESTGWPREPAVDIQYLLELSAFAGRHAKVHRVSRGHPGRTVGRLSRPPRALPRRPWPAVFRTVASQPLAG